MNEPNQPTEQPKRSKSKKVLFILLAVLLLTVTAGVVAYWWYNRPITPTVLSEQEQRVLDQKVEAVQEPVYEAGGKVIVLTEREVNALLHHNTNLGDKVKIEFATDAVHARIHTDLDPDLPILGGKELKARARFKLITEQGSPAIILDDLTVWGISLPNAWLGDLKGKNLLSNLGLELKENRVGRGIEEISVKSGEIRIRLAE